VALGKGAFGGGLAILGIPLLALVVDPVMAAIMVAPIVSVSDMFALGAFPPRTWSWPDMIWLAPGMLVGLALGWLFFVEVNPRIVALGIAIVIVWFAARYLLQVRKKPVSEAPVSPAKALAAGAAAGFTTFISHAGGPPVAVYLLPRGLPKTIYAGTTVALFTMCNAIKLLPYLTIGLHRPEALWAAAALSPALPLGVWVGKLMHDRLDEKRLYFWCYILVGIAGLKMLFDSVRALMV